MKCLTITNTTDDIVEILLEHNGTTDLPYAVVPGQSIQIGDIDTAKGVVVRTRSEGWPAVMSGAAPDLSHLNLEGYVRSVLRVLVEKLGDRVDRIEERVQDLAENFEDRIDVLEQEWLAQRDAKGCVPPPNLPIPPENLDQWADAVEAVQAEIEKRERARQYPPQAPIVRDSQGRLRVGGKPNPNPSEEAQP